MDYRAINIKVDEELYIRFKQACEEQGANVSFIIRLLIKDFVDNGREICIKANRDD